MSPISGSGARSGSGASSGSGAKPGSVPNSGSAKTPPLSGDSSSRERAEGPCVPSVEVPRTSWVKGQKVCPESRIFTD